MDNILKEKHYYFIGIFLFLNLSLSLFIGLLLDEDASGRGTSNDFKNTWDYVLLLKNNYIIDGSQWTRLLPVHYIFLSFLYNFSEKIFNVRMIFCLISILIPFIFYKNLLLKFKDISKGRLLIISSLIFTLPFFRSSVIWPNPHVLSLLFLMISIYYDVSYREITRKSLNLAHSLVVP